MPIEQIIFLLDGIRRRWLLFLLPILVAVPIALLVLQMAPTKYEAKSTILMSSANRGAQTGGLGVPRHIALEQVAVLDAWLKSDQIIQELLPQLTGIPAPISPEVLGVQAVQFRRLLVLELVGSAVLEVRLESSEAIGLGRKLEIIIARLLEGVLNPEAGILSASQMITTRRADAINEADTALTRAIMAARLGSPDEVKSKLQALQRLKREAQAQLPIVSRSVQLNAAETTVADSADGKQDAADPLQTPQLDAARAEISSDPKVVRKLEQLFDSYEEARIAYQDIRERAGGSSSSYVRVFDAPERLTVIGRPRDPTGGTSSGRKYAIAIMLLSVLGGLGTVALAVMMDTRLRVGEDFEAIAEVPIVARLPRARAV